MGIKSISNKDSILVLVFNPLKRFIGVFKSCNAAANALGVSPVNIHFACTGKSISACNLYFRYCERSELCFETLEVISLQGWDRIHHLERLYYPTKQMKRDGMKHITKLK